MPLPLCSFVYFTLLFLMLLFFSGNFQKLQNRVCAAHVAYTFFVRHSQSVRVAYACRLACTRLLRQIVCPSSTSHRIEPRLSEQLPQSFCHFLVSHSHHYVRTSSLIMLQECCVAKGYQGQASHLEFFFFCISDNASRLSNRKGSWSFVAHATHNFLFKCVSLFRDFP